MMQYCCFLTCQVRHRPFLMINLTILDVPIDNIVKNAWKFYNSVPASCVTRVHSSSFLRKKYKITSGQRHTWEECPCPPIYFSDLNALRSTRTVLVIDMRPEFM